MAVIRIKHFGGEVPSASSRTLPPAAARTSRNLMAQSNEFRPLKVEVARATTVAGNKTLYRMSRDAAGAFNTNPALNWISAAASVNYVRGQLDDDRTERTYYTAQDGLSVPKVVTAPMTLESEHRLLGVPAPAKPVCAINNGTEFTRKEADSWVNITLLPGLVNAALASLPRTELASRVVTEVPVAGPYTYTARGFTWATTTAGGDGDGWNLRYDAGEAVAARAAGLADPLLQPETVGANIRLRITCLPAWGPVSSTATLKTAFLAITHPRAEVGGLLMSDALATNLANALQTEFSATSQSLKSRRDRLDAILTEFKLLVVYSLTGVTAVNAEPTRPGTAEYLEVSDGVVVASTATEWVNYRTALTAYNTSVTANTTTKAAFNNERQSRIDKLVGLQAEAGKITKEIEVIWEQQRDSQLRKYTDFVAGRGFDFNEDPVTTNTTNTVVIDADRIIESRFYVMTFVNDWGEESAPGPVSNILTVSQYQRVTTSKPASVPAGYNIVGWRLYRSNSGNTTEGFQLVSDSASLIAQNTAAGVFDYFKTVTAETGYLDALKSNQLQEPLPSATWATPPTNVIGIVTTYLAGLTGMPNGVMAGFMDNTVCFCEPYLFYAWPVEYQLTVKAPIVGMASFGQSLFVGTQGAPFLINGADSGSMNLQELPGNQACVSARSIVPVENGVLYASPDGICLADAGGVKVITQALFTREDWQALVPAGIIAALHDGCYYFVVSGGTVCYALDFSTGKLTQMALSGTVTALYADRSTDTLFALIGTSILALFDGATRRTGLYRTGIQQLSKPEALAWLQVDGDQSISVPATLRWFGDGTLRHTSTLTGITPVRLPSGRYLEHEIEIESLARITSVVLAGSTQELQAV